MSTKNTYYLAGFIGSTIGSYIPVLWGDRGFLSVSSLLFGAFFGILAIVIVYKRSK